MTERVRGWKAIAEVLGVEVRAAQSYVRAGLPVSWFDPWRGVRRRRRARRRPWSGMVEAERSELVAWRRARTFAHRRAA